MKSALLEWAHVGILDAVLYLQEAVSLFTGLVGVGLSTIKHLWNTIAIQYVQRSRSALKSAINESVPG